MRKNTFHLESLNLLQHNQPQSWGELLTPDKIHFINPNGNCVTRVQNTKVTAA